MLPHELVGLIIKPQSAHAAGWTFLSQVSHVVHIPEHVLTFVFVGLFLVSLGVFYRIGLGSRGSSVVPAPNFSLSNLVELFGDFIMTQCKSLIGKEQGPKYFAFVAFVFIALFRLFFIQTGNVIAR